MADEDGGKIICLDEYRINGNSSPLPHASRSRINTDITDMGEYRRFKEAKVNYNILEAIELFLRSTLDEVRIYQKNRTELARQIEKLTTAFLINKINGSTKVEWVAEPVY
jgi:hypothetical protein